MHPNLSVAQTLPDWLPQAVRLYLDHTEDGLSLRAIARRDGSHASTVLRQVRRYEGRRDDPLLDAALQALSRHTTRSLAEQGLGPPQTPFDEKEPIPMSAPIRHQTLNIDEATILREGKRILRRLAEPGAVLAIAPDMEKAAVMRIFPDGKTARTGIVDRAVAQAFALKDWITCRKTGRVASYELSATGRSALKRMLEQEEAGRLGMAESAMPFGAQHGAWGSKDMTEPGGVRTRARYNLAESPVAILGRRRDKDGRAFLEQDLVAAAERLREDFELSQMGPRVAQNWDRFLTAGDRGGFHSDSGGAEGPRAARDRVALALRDLGPGLGDVALRVCCFLEGIEAAERRMGWAARSGKIVLRIALQRLRRHYDATYGRSGPLIG
ncbi:MAG: DUF6456 domain-containing protein [Alphaproteobacteria bacterium]